MVLSLYILSLKRSANPKNTSFHCALQTRVMICGGLGKNGLHRLLYLNAYSLRRIRILAGMALLGIAMAFLAEVFH